MKQKSPEERVLDELVQTVRGDRIREFDSRALEAQLRQRWLSQRQSPLVAATSRLARRAPLALAAAMILLATIAGVRHLNGRGTISLHESASRGIDGNQLQVGEPIISGELPLTVTHAGKATWTLAPRGQAKILAVKPCLTLGLEAGQIDADVLPSTQIETFAIETRTHRIAVHGTRFSVAVEPDAILVEVSSGSVVVARRNHPGSNARSLLTAPQRLRFPTQEPASAPSIVAPAPLTSVTHYRPKAPPPSGEQTIVAASLPAAASETPLHPTLLEQQTALDAVRAAAARCFAQANALDADSHSDEVTVRVETLLTVSIAPSGNVQELSFVPPIPPGISDCTQREIASWSTSPSRLGSDTSRSIILTK